MGNPKVSPNRPKRTLTRSEHYETLLEVAGSVVSNLDLSELFRELLNRIQDLGKFDFLLLLHDAVENVMRLTALHAMLLITVPVSLQIPVDESLDGWVWKNQRCLVITDLATENGFPRHVEMIYLS